METVRQPDSSLAAQILPPPLYRALTHLSAQDLNGVMLVGGTALAGYYAGHRRSDDLDLFTEAFVQNAQQWHIQGGTLQATVEPPMD